MTNRLSDFQTYRKEMNSRIADIEHLGIKRFLTWIQTLIRMLLCPAKPKNCLGWSLLW